jgi:hypothetical protein
VWDSTLSEISKELRCLPAGHSVHIEPHNRIIEEKPCHNSFGLIPSFRLSALAFATWSAACLICSSSLTLVTACQAGLAVKALSSAQCMKIRPCSFPKRRPG